MGQIRRVVAVGCPHHITERGNFGRDVFLDDGDRLTYLDLLAEYSLDARLHVLGYCLMSNHIHLIAVPERPDSMATAMRLAHQTYSHWLNIRLRRRGHVWQNRYFSCPLDPAHAAYAMRYVEYNPVRAGIVESAFDYRWSSARAHCGLEPACPLRDVAEWQQRYSAEKWTEVLGLGFHLAGDLDRLREATRTGRPFGTPDFVAELEAKLDRTLQPQKRGRKPKAEVSAKGEKVQTAGHG